MDADLDMCVKQYGGADQRTTDSAASVNTSVIDSVASGEVGQASGAVICGELVRRWDLECGKAIEQRCRHDLIIIDLCRAGHYADHGCRGWPVSWGSVSW